MAIEVGKNAPEFTMPSHDGQKLSLSQFRGQPVVFAWYPFAFTAG